MTPSDLQIKPMCIMTGALVKAPVVTHDVEIWRSFTPYEVNNHVDIFSARNMFAASSRRTAELKSGSDSNRPSEAADG